MGRAGSWRARRAGCFGHRHPRRASKESMTQLRSELSSMTQLRSEPSSKYNFVLCIYICILLRLCSQGRSRSGKAGQPLGEKTLWGLPLADCRDRNSWAMRKKRVPQSLRCLWCLASANVCAASLAGSHGLRACFCFLAPSSFHRLGIAPARYAATPRCQTVIFQKCAWSKLGAWPFSASRSEQKPLTQDETRRASREPKWRLGWWRH